MCTYIHRERKRKRKSKRKIERKRERKKERKRERCACFNSWLRCDRKHSFLKKAKIKTFGHQRCADVPRAPPHTR